MYNGENNAQSLFRDVMVCFVFDGPLGGGRLNKVKHRCGSLCHSLGLVLVLVLACLLYFTHSLNYSWISNVSAIKNRKAFTLFHE